MSLRSEDYEDGRGKKGWGTGWDTNLQRRWRLLAALVTALGASAGCGGGGGGGGKGSGAGSDDPEPTLSATGETVAETNGGEPSPAFKLKLSAATDREVRVKYATKDGTARAGQDYVAAAGQMTFTPGETEKTILVTVIQDDLPEREETLFLRLSGAVNARLSEGEARAVILEGEEAGSGLDGRPSNPDCVFRKGPGQSGGSHLEPAFPKLWLTGHLSQAVGILQAPGDSSRWFVVDRKGVIRSFENEDDVDDSRVFLDIRSRVLLQGEAGLLSMTFHPRFAENGRAYVFYTSSETPPTSGVSGFRSLDGGRTLSPSTEQAILRFQKGNDYHNGGHLAFGPDGYLYIGFGDEEDFAAPQDLNDIRGKIIRVDVDGGNPYTIPPDNPLASGGGRPEIYAWGFRNPWRWSFDRSAGHLWLADVGERSMEEIDVVERGKNYGWPIREGSECYGGDCSRTDLVGPVHEWSHEDGARAGVGGFVYRGSALPELAGAYVFGDWGDRKIWALDTTTKEIRLLAEVDSGVIYSFAEDTAGEIYVLTGGKRIHRIEPSNPSTGETLPQRLSDLGCVDSDDPSLPTPWLIPYDINVPFWSDGAAKERWLAIPDGKSIVVKKDGDWDLPVGSVVMKTFRLDGKLVETRILARHEDSGWTGYSYEWNAAGTDAELLPSGKTKSVGRRSWKFPSPGECLHCHTDAAGGTLGLETAQLNRSFLYPSTGRTRNQLTTFEESGFLASPLPGDPEDLPALPRMDDPTAPIEARARAYLHANCSHCHRSGGTTRGAGDYRFHLSFEDMGICNRDPPEADPLAPGAVLLAPGNPSKSLILNRMAAEDSRHMPPIGVRVVDGEGLDLLRSWIRSVRGCP